MRQTDYERPLSRCRVAASKDGSWPTVSTRHFFHDDCFPQSAGFGSHTSREENSIASRVRLIAFSRDRAIFKVPAWAVNCQLQLNGGHPSRDGVDPRR